MASVHIFRPVEHHGRVWTTRHDRLPLTPAEARLVWAIEDAAEDAYHARNIDRALWFGFGLLFMAGIAVALWYLG